MKRSWTPVFDRISTSTKLADLPSHRERLFYLMLLAQVDSWGRISAEPRQLHAAVWPMLGETPASTAECLAACIRAGLLVIRESGALRWIQMPDWEDKAGKLLPKAKRGASVWPESGVSPELVQTNSKVTLPNSSTEEEKRESESETVASPPTRARAREAFDPKVYALENFPAQAPALLPTIDRWIEYRRSIGKPWKPPTWRAQLRDAALDPARWAASVEQSIRQGWNGLFDVRSEPAPQSKPTGMDAVRSYLAKQQQKATP